jgi:hypothetical protein
MTVENGGRMGVRFKGLRFISKILKVAIANYRFAFYTSWSAIEPINFQL